jgi:hypothetical protein
MFPDSVLVKRSSHEFTIGNTVFHAKNRKILGAARVCQPCGKSHFLSNLFHSLSLEREPRTNFTVSFETAKTKGRGSF